MRQVKTTAITIGVLIGLLMVSGCASRPGWGIVNNTGYSIVVVQDNKTAAQLKPGQTIELLSTSWREPSLVSILAYDEYTNYIGANVYTFSRFAPYNWQVDHVFRPEGAR